MPQWVCQCGYRNHAQGEWCNQCQLHFSQVTWHYLRRSRSKSTKEKKGQPKGGIGQFQFEQAELTEPWSKSTPQRTLPTPNVEKGIAKVAPRASAASVETPSYEGMEELQQLKEKFKDQLPPAFSEALEKFTVKGMPSGPKLTHALLNKANTARSAYQKSRGRVLQLDSQWKAFTDLLRSNYAKQHERYTAQRQEAVDAAKSKRQRWEEVQQEIKATTQQSVAPPDTGDSEMAPEMEEMANMPWDQEIVLDSPEELPDPGQEALQPFRRRMESPPDKMRKIDEGGGK